MSSIVIALIAFACTFGGVLLGMVLRYLLPGHHLRDESKDVLKTATGLIATLVALVLGLLVGSAKSSFDEMNTGLTQMGAKIIALHWVLVRYGPEANGTQELLRSNVAAGIDRIWPSDKTKPVDLAVTQAATGAEDVHQSIQQLSPKTDAQRSLQAQALQISGDLMQTRWLLIEQTENSVPTVFLVILIFWLTVLYAGFGLFTPRHATPIGALVICAMSISAAVFLVLEMNHPLVGVIKVSSAPLQKALEALSH